MLKFTALITAFMLMFIATLWSQDVMLQVEDINIDITGNISEQYIQRFIRIKKGDRLTQETLDRKLEIIRIEVQADANIYLFDYEYSIEDLAVTIDCKVIDASIMRFSFGAFSSGAIFYYRNFLTENFNFGGHVGFGRQMLFADLSHIGNSPIGLSLLTGHRIFNEFSSDYRTFSVGSTNRLYLWLGNHTRFGILNDIYRNYEGWDKAKGIWNVSLGGFASLDYRWLLDLIRFGFDIKTDYRYFFQDVNPAHDISVKIDLLAWPFNSNRFTIKVRNGFEWSSNTITERNSMRSSSVYGNSSWDVAIYLPILIGRISGASNFYLGLEPGFIFGQAGDENLNFGSVKTAISMGAAFQVGFPASVFLAPRLVYNFSEEQWSFSLGFSSLPYTSEIDLDW